MIKDLKDILKEHQNDFGNVVPFDLNDDNVPIFDFTASNKDLEKVDIDDEQSFTSYIFDKLQENGSPVGIGQYNEDRVIYKRSAVFTANEIRSIHLGIDIWAAAGTPVYCPIDGVVHSFRNNKTHGDYGPTIILKHDLGGRQFYTLYGHLNSAAIRGLEKNQQITKGVLLGKLGEYHENVHWPPHLHFQIIRNIAQHTGDYPGVAPPSKREDYLHQCPDPNLILGVKKLEY